MAKITRFNGNLQAFASEATGQERTIFGVETQADDLTSQIGALFRRGWGIVSPTDSPKLQDFNALGYTTTQLLAYLHQVGVPEWNGNQDFYTGSATLYNGRIWIAQVNEPADEPGTSAQWETLLNLSDASVAATPGKMVKRGETGSADEGTAKFAAPTDPAHPALYGKTLTVFSSVANMKADGSLRVGVKCHTLGYYTPGDGGGNDYEIVAAATGTDDGGSFIDLSGNGLQAKGLFVDGVNFKQFGATGDGVTDDFAAFKNGFDYCVLERLDVYAPPGTYVTYSKNFPFRQENVPVSALRDCNNVTVFGSGYSTVFKTISPDGADVLQLNGVKNLHFKNFRIESELTGFNDAGSNGVSITNGWDNLTFEGIQIYNLPYVKKIDYLDGGKAFTIQPGLPTVTCGSIYATGIYAYGCVFGYGLEVDASHYSEKSSSIYIEGVAEKCHYGVECVATAANAALPDYASYGFTFKGRTINCQYDVLSNRGRGLNWEVDITSSEGITGLRINPSTGLNWDDDNLTVTALYSVYTKNSKINVAGNKPSCNSKAIVGGTSDPLAGDNGATTGCAFYLDVAGTSFDSDIEIIDFGGNTAAECVFYISKKTTINIPAVLYSNGNVILNNGTLSLSSLLTEKLEIDQSLKLNASGSIVGSIDVVNGLIGFRHQISTGSSYIGTAFLNFDGEIALGCTNSGGIVVNGIGTADAIGTYVGKHPIYDKNGTLIGWIPIYT